MRWRVLAVAAGGVMFTIAGVAVAGSFFSSAETDFFSKGKHQFYVWCAQSSDRMAVASGDDAEDAQMRLYDSLKASGSTTCWPVWQGRLKG